jgi:hypothetical protein
MTDITRPVPAEISNTEALQELAGSLDRIAEASEESARKLRALSLNAPNATTGEYADELAALTRAVERLGDILDKRLA